MSLTTTNKNRFEEIIDNLLIDEVAGIDLELKNDLLNLPLEQKRLGILSILDNDRELFMKVYKLVRETNVTKVEHIDEVVNMLREYVKVGTVEKKKFGEVMTPISLVENMLNTLPSDVWSNPNLKWIDPCNGVGIFPCIIVQRLMKGLVEFEADEELRYKHIVENMLYVCELQAKNMFLFLSAFDPEDKYLLNIFHGSFLSEEFDKHCKEVWGIEKFDVCSMNPPYNSGIDLDFLVKSIEICNRVVSVQPSTFLLDMKGKRKKFSDVKSLLNGKTEKINFFNGNGIFGIALFVPCVYFSYNKNHNGESDVNYFKESFKANISELNKFGKYSSSAKSIMKKVHTLSKNGSVWNKRISQSHTISENKFYCQLANVRGNVDISSNDMFGKIVKDDFYTTVLKDSDKNKGIRNPDARKDNYIVFEFDSEIQLNNFISYNKTMFFRICLALLKNSGVIGYGEMELIPWMDLDKSWTDVELFELFHFTSEEIEFINCFIPEYY